MRFHLVVPPFLPAVFFSLESLTIWSFMTDYCCSKSSGFGGHREGYLASRSPRSVDFYSLKCVRLEGSELCHTVGFSCVFAIIRFPSCQAPTRQNIFEHLRYPDL